MLYAHLSEPPPLVTDHRPELPAGLDAVIGKAMAKNPDNRYQSAGEMLEELTRFARAHASTSASWAGRASPAITVKSEIRTST